jgi:hypothetical protein
MFEAKFGQPGKGNGKEMVEDLAGLRGGTSWRRCSER